MLPLRHPSSTHGRAPSRVGGAGDQRVQRRGLCPRTRFLTTRGLSMKKHIQTFCSLVRKKVLDTSHYLFGRGQRLSTLTALLLTFAAPAAKAVDLGDLGNAS